MKKLLLVLILSIGFAGVLFAWEPEDLTKFPPCTEARDLIVNLGIGYDFPANIGGNYIYVPPVRLTLDYNLALGDNGLPFFFGGIFGYSGYGKKNDYFYSKLRIGARVGYHFNWGVDKLDTYAVATAGWTLYLGDGYGKLGITDRLVSGINIGARWFVNDWFGFWVEAGFTSISIFDIGLAFKF